MNENCYLKSTNSSSSSSNEITPKQSSLDKLLNRFNKQESNSSLKRSVTNAQEFCKMIKEEYNDELNDVCNSLLNVNESSTLNHPRSSNRSNSLLILNNSNKQLPQRRSFSSLFESTSFSTELNLISNLQTKRDRRRSSGLLRSKNLLNQIKNIDYASETIDLENGKILFVIFINQLFPFFNLTIQVEELEKRIKEEKKQVLTSINTNSSNSNNNKSKETTLDIIISIYNSEINYLKLLKYTFEIYAEPLR